MEASEIAYLVQQVGMPNPNVPGWPNGDVWWTATVMAESSGNPKAVKGTHYGLLQMSAQHAGKHPPGSPTDPESYKQAMFNPIFNLQGGKSLFAVQGVKAWESSNAGRRSWKSRAEFAVALPKQPDLGEVTTGLEGRNPSISDVIPDPLEGLLGWIGKSAAWITEPDNWIRIVQVGGGIALAIVAAGIVIKPVIQSSTPIGRALR